MLKIVVLLVSLVISAVQSVVTWGSDSAGDISSKDVSKEDVQCSNGGLRY